MFEKVFKLSLLKSFLIEAKYLVIFIFVCKNHILASWIS